MSISNYPRAVGEWIAICVFAAALVGAKLLGGRVDLWPPAGKAAALVCAVLLVTWLTLRATRGGKTRR